MNCLSCYKKHLSLSYIHCNLYLKQKDNYNKLRAYSQAANALQHGRNMTKKQFEESFDICKQFEDNDFEITIDIISKLYNAYYR